MAINGQLTSARCLTIGWRGHQDWCQPWQFADAAALEATVQYRLWLAGLRLLALEYRPGADLDHEWLWCEVGRAGVPHGRAVGVNQTRQGWAEQVKMRSGGRAGGGTTL